MAAFTCSWQRSTIPAAIDHAAHIMQVTGTATSVNGFNALYVRGFVKK
jgi:hypothetical protein